MKKLLRYGFTAFALIFILSAFGATQTNAQVTNEILKRMDAHYKALKSLQANISRETIDSNLGETDKMSGTITLLPGKGRNLSFRLDWAKPRQEIISVVNGQYVLYTPKTNQAFTGTSDSKNVKGKGGNALKVLSMDKAEMKANYDIEYLGEETVNGGTKTWHLKLTPKAKSEFKFLEIWVDSSGMPIQLKNTQSNNDTDTVLLSDLKKNSLKDGSIFKVSLPKGTNVVKG